MFKINIPVNVCRYTLIMAHPCRSLIILGRIYFPSCFTAYRGIFLNRKSEQTNATDQAIFIFWYNFILLTLATQNAK